MAKAKYPHKTLKKLLDADEGLLAADFDVLSGVSASSAELNVLDSIPATLTGGELGILDGVTASAAELNYLDTSAAGTVTAGKVMTVDANAQVSGWRRKAIDMDGGGVTAPMAGSIISNFASGSTATFSLPAALVGMEFYFYVLAAVEMRLDPNGTETIGLPSSGVQQAAGKYIVADAIGEYVHIVCVKAGQWETLDYRGTWTAEAP
jgi:hypothetical protein